MDGRLKALRKGAETLLKNKRGDIALVVDFRFVAMVP